MAAPNAAGVAALVVAAHPDWSPDRVIDALFKTARKVGDTRYYGAGVLAADQAVRYGGQYTPPAPGPSPTALPSPTPSPRTRYSEEIWELVNAERVKAGLPALVWDQAIYTAAQGHNLRMNDCQQDGGSDCLQHILPGEADPTTRVRQAGFNAAFVLEDIGHGYQTPRDMIAGWMDSPGHRAAILDTRVTHGGAAFYDGSGQGWYMGLWWTLNLARSADGGGGAPNPTPVPPPSSPAPRWDAGQRYQPFRLLAVTLNNPTVREKVRAWAYDFDPAYNAAAPGFVFRDARGAMTPGNSINGAVQVDLVGGIMWTRAHDLKLYELEQLTGMRAQFGTLNWAER
jgi:uncharacterized protein YkwD